MWGNGEAHEARVTISDSFGGGCSGGLGRPASSQSVNCSGEGAACGDSSDSSGRRTVDRGASLDHGRQGWDRGSPGRLNPCDCDDPGHDSFDASAGLHHGPEGQHCDRAHCDHRHQGAFAHSEQGVGASRPRRGTGQGRRASQSAGTYEPGSDRVERDACNQCPDRGTSPGPGAAPRAS